MKKILVLDDEKLIRKMLTHLFEKNGYEVIGAGDGNSGMKLFKEHEPDLIITDLIMPEKEGLETIREMRGLRPNVKIIAMSGGGAVDPETYLNLAEKLGANSSCAKPIDTMELLSKVRNLLEG